jgi:hypothetical protein
MRNRELGNHDATFHLGHQNCLSTRCRASRRQFLKSLLVLGSGSMLPPNSLLGRLRQAASGGGGAVKPYRIEVHHHLLSPAYLGKSSGNSDWNATEQVSCCVLGGLDNVFNCQGRRYDRTSIIRNARSRVASTAACTVWSTFVL